MPHIKKAELIEGVIHMPSPAHYASHSRPHAHLLVWLGNYSAATSGVQLADNVTVRLDQFNEVQPDALLRLAVTPLLAGDLATVLAELQTGLAA
jgi:Putative restriction endonuclease